MNRTPQERENQEPQEGSSVEKFFIPVLLLGFIAGFGVCYLWLRTPDLTAHFGDSAGYFMQDQTASPDSAHPSDADKGNGNASLADAGKGVYERICQACHQANGQGLPGAFPPLAGSSWVTGDAIIPVAVVLKGLQGSIVVNGTTFNGVMTPFGEILGDQDIAAAVTYIRSSWGNQASAVTPEEVAKIRSQLSSHTEPWNGEEELKSLSQP